jgi:aspartate carbamoyltransferase regulatory subunit
LSLIAGEKIRLKKSVDAMYVTRFQKERWADKDQDYPKIDARFLKEQKYSHTALLHPLPRVGELDISLDSDPRAAYFRQAAFGVPIRMALIALLLGVDKKRHLEQFADGFRSGAHAVYDQPHDFGIRCANSNCIVHDPMERQYTRNKFYVIEEPTPRLRCYYCENDIHEFVVASKRSKQYDLTAKPPRKNEKDIAIFDDAFAAEEAGFAAKPAATKRTKKRA